jgi:hypothetical protein
MKSISGMPRVLPSRVVCEQSRTFSDSGTAFGVLVSFFGGLSGGVVADSLTPGYFLSAFRADSSNLGIGHSLGI